jgi:hypothetical protein
MQPETVNPVVTHCGDRNERGKRLQDDGILDGRFVSRAIVSTPAALLAIVI